MKTKKMTVKYWNSLERGSKQRALKSVFPLLPYMVDSLLNEKPDPKNNPHWKLVFKLVRIPEDDSHYKTFVNPFFIP